MVNCAETERGDTPNKHDGPSMPDALPYSIRYRVRMRGTPQPPVGQKPMKAQLGLLRASWAKIDERHCISAPTSRAVTVADS